MKEGEEYVCVRCGVYFRRLGRGKMFTYSQVPSNPAQESIRLVCAFCEAKAGER